MRTAVEVVVMAMLVAGASAACGRSEIGPWASQGDGPPVDALGSCAEILADDPDAPSGVHVLDPDPDGDAWPFDAYCDMTTAGGGWTLVAKIAGDDRVDRWSWDADAYRRGAPFGDAVSLAPTDAKSAAYARVPGREVLIVDLGGPAHVAHAYARSPQAWGDFLGSIWGECGHLVASEPIVLVDDGRDSVIGPQLYFRHYDQYFPDCEAEERAMLSELEHNAGWVEVGVGITEGNADHRDAQSAPLGTSSRDGNVAQAVEDYAFFVR